MVMAIENPAHEFTYWEGVSATCWGRYLTDVQRRVVFSVCNTVGRPGTVLEIGADGGRWSGALATEGWEVICTDISAKALGLCQKRMPRAKCIIVRPTDKSLPCDPDAVNVVLCMEVDTVISSEWFIEEASRVLAPGGVLVATLNNRSSLRAVFHKIFRPHEAITRKQRGYYQVTYRERRMRLSKSGFRMIHEEGCCWPPFARDSNSPLVPFFVELEKYSGLRRLPILSPWVVFAAQKVQQH